MKKGAFISLLIVLISFMLSAFLQPHLPERIATHWNEKGEVDGYTDRGTGLYILPAISLILVCIFLVIPLIDPLKENIKQFMGYYEGMIVTITAFLLYIHTLTILWNLGYRFDMIQSMAPAFAVIYYYMGTLTENARPNWFIGVRTPWTLSDETVWEKTNKRGGILFKISGALSLIALFLPDYAIYLIVLPVLATAVYLVAYSYMEYQKTVKKNHGE